jgi:AcrR family transcriptional regulator
MAGLPEQGITVPTGRHGLPAEVVAEYQRERLLMATIELVAKRGYRGTSVDHIVKSAKVGHVAFYDLFEDKEDCFLTAFDQIVGETRDELARAVSSDAEWPEQICTALSTLLELIVTHPAKARVGLVEIQAAGHAAFTRYEEAIDGAAPKLREGRRLSAAASELSDTLEEAILGGIVWILHQRLVMGEVADSERLLGDILQIALAPYLGESEAQRFTESVASARAGKP